MIEAKPPACLMLALASLACIGQPAPAPPTAAASKTARASSADRPAWAALVQERLAAIEAPAPAAPPASAAISGTIVLPRARRANVKSGDTIFIAVRGAGGATGPGALLAALRLQAGAFPLAFSVDERDAMMPGARLEGTVSVTVRVDKDGDPLTLRVWDVHGHADGVKVGARGVQVALDSLQAEDVTLEGRALVEARAAHEAPPLLPPGHP
jgi:hypothetical protein